MARTLPALLGLAALFVAVAPAHAGKGSCLLDGSSPRCHVVHGKVTLVADGDTIGVNIAGDGTSKRWRVRMSGLNAMEMTRYSHYRDRRRGVCHAVAATNRLDDLLRAGNMRVKLMRQSARSERGARRLRRTVYTRIGGRWVDVAAVLLREGHALWLPSGTEWAWNRRHSEAAQSAARRGIRLWNPNACGARFASRAELSMRVRYDAAGNDGRNPNGEWADIRNHSQRPVSIARWWFRDSALRQYRFPRGATIPAGGKVRLRVGRGRNGGGTFHWGLSSPVFENPSYARRWTGDGGYLFDPQGNVRAFFIYPAL